LPVDVDLERAATAVGGARIGEVGQRGLGEAEGLEGGRGVAGAEQLVLDGLAAGGLGEVAQDSNGRDGERVGLGDDGVGGVEDDDFGGVLDVGGGEDLGVGDFGRGEADELCGGDGVEPDL